MRPSVTAHAASTIAILLSLDGTRSRLINQVMGRESPSTRCSLQTTHKKCRNKRSRRRKRLPESWQSEAQHYLVPRPVDIDENAGFDSSGTGTSFRKPTRRVCKLTRKSDPLFPSVMPYVESETPIALPKGWAHACRIRGPAQQPLTGAGRHRLAREARSL
jgi:hypothetical protein